MRIGIIGATGNAGREVYAESVRRGHDTVAIVRNGSKAREILGADVALLERDAFELTREDLAGFDVVVDAFATAPAQAYLHVDLATRLVALFRETTSPRLVFILGAGSLVAGEDGHLFVEDIRTFPGAEHWVSIPENQLKELDFLRGVDDVAWVGLSPSDLFTPGPAGPFELGVDDLLRGEDGASVTTTGTYAVALLDEIERPAHINTRFTVRDTGHVEVPAH